MQSAARVLINGVLGEFSLEPATVITTTFGTSNTKIHVVNVGCAFCCDVFGDSGSLRQRIHLRFGGVASILVGNDRTKTTRTNEDSEEGCASSSSLTLVFSKLKPTLNKTEVDFKSEIAARLSNQYQANADDEGASKFGASSISGMAKSCQSRAPLHACEMIACMSEVNSFKGADGEHLCVANKRNHAATSSNPLPQIANTTTTTSSVTKKNTSHANGRANSATQLPPRIDGTFFDIAAISKRAASGEAIWRQCAASFSTMMRHLQKSHGAFCWHADERRRTVIARSQ